jgi:hypothetical protein
MRMQFTVQEGRQALLLVPLCALFREFSEGAEAANVFERAISQGFEQLSLQ